MRTLCDLWSGHSKERSAPIVTCYARGPGGMHDRFKRGILRPADRASRADARRRGADRAFERISTSLHRAEPREHRTFEEAACAAGPRIALGDAEVPRVGSVDGCRS